jgi:uncharacterized membrane protein YgdD (TMEM256/DUF423 family)
MPIMENSRVVCLGAAFAGLAVAGGAFGAHFLKPILDSAMLAVFETAVRYQMYHALALCIVPSIDKQHRNPSMALVGWLFTAGIVLFSGSLYVLSLTGIRWVGALTPFGGVAFIAGWVVLAWTVARRRHEPNAYKEPSASR